MKTGTALIVGIVLFAAIIGGALYYITLQKPQAIAIPPTSSSSGGTVVSGSVPCGQNPTLTLSFINALTGQSITATPYNYKDPTTGAVLGAEADASLSVGQKIIPIINATGYLTAVQPEYTAVCGNQLLTGQLYQHANQTIQMYTDAGTGVIGSGTSSETLGYVGNDTSFSTQHNNKIVLTGNTYKSSGRLFAIYEVSNTSSVASATLTEAGATTPVPTVAVPNCYANNLSGTPYRVAWELPALVGGVQKTYNLQTVSSNGYLVESNAYFIMYTEADAVDTGTGALLTSGICDSLNTKYYKDRQINTWKFVD